MVGKSQFERYPERNVGEESPFGRVHSSGLGAEVEGERCVWDGCRVVGYDW